MFNKKAKFNTFVKYDLQNETEGFSMKHEIIARPIYLERIKPFINKQIIKVLVGQRRIGKSYVLLQSMEYLKQTIPNANLIRIDMELEEFRHLRLGSELYTYIKTQLNPSVPNFLFIDEIQEVDGFENAIRSLHNENETDIYITGSNAKMLSGELASTLSGRYIQIDIHGLSYEEFLRFHAIENNQNSLASYLTIGGMPYLRHLGTEQDVVFEYLRNVYSTILLKDVVAREGIRNVSFLENLVAFLSDNVGSLVSAQNIARFLKSQHITIPVPTIISYIQAIANSYFFHKVQRADVNGLKIFEVGEKYFFEDIGLRNCIRSFGFGKDINKLMENVIYLHLVRHQYKVFVGKHGDKEIDFVAEKNGERIFVQAAYMLQDEATIKREFGNLLSIPDNFPKYVVTMDPIQVNATYQGIKQLPLSQFLLMTEF